MATSGASLRPVPVFQKPHRSCQARAIALRNDSRFSKESFVCRAAVPVIQFVEQFFYGRVELAITPVQSFANRPSDWNIDGPGVHLHRTAVGGGDFHEWNPDGRSIDQIHI